MLRTQTHATAPGRRGFTLIELLVVIAIIAVLIAPALAGRAVGPRGRAPGPVHQQPQADRPRRDANYESANGCFPPNGDWQGCITPGSSARATASSSSMAPYLEQTAVANAMNYNGCFLDAANMTAMGTRHQHPLVCPSDGHLGRPRSRPPSIQRLHRLGHVHPLLLQLCRHDRDLRMIEPSPNLPAVRLHQPQLQHVDQCRERHAASG